MSLTENDILNLEKACEFLGVSERTLIKLLREEYLPTRKIGREWRLSKQTLINWISLGDSYNYSNQMDVYAVYEDSAGSYETLLDDITRQLQQLKELNDINRDYKDSGAKYLYSRRSETKRQL